MKLRAFTLIEMLLSMAVIAILAAIMTPVFLSFQTRNDVDIAAMSLVRSIRRAEQLSRNGEGDSAWGVNLSSGAVTVFKGSTYASRDAGFDEIFSIPNNITFTGTSSIVFSKLYGLPAASSTIVLTSVNNESRTITINARGAVSMSIPAAATSTSPVTPVTPSVTLSVSTASIAEAAGTATLTATLSATTTNIVTVNLAYSGSATVTSDYTRPSLITVAAGSLSGTGTLTAVQDALYEGNETIIIDIDSVVNGTESGSQQQTVTIVDDDPAGFICGTDQVTITTVAGHTCSTAYPDYDTCTYDTVLIGSQCWMKQNLNIGTRIDGYSYYQTDNGTLEKFCYNETTSYCQTYGGLYEFDEALQYSSSEGVQGICPSGWHVPTDAEWTTLSSYLTANGQSGTEGTALKAVSPTWDGTNNFGFTAISAGNLNSSYSYAGLTTDAYFRTSSVNSTYGWYRRLSSGSAVVTRYSDFKTLGLSVRCLKN